MINKHLDLTNPGFDHDDGSCLKCDIGHAHDVKNPKTGKWFIGCDNWPACDNKAPDLGPFAPPMGLMSDDEVMECWAEAQLADKDWW